MDKYQRRYLAHQKRKREVIMKIIRDRHSSRLFSREKVGENDLAFIMWSLGRGPSSCDRKGVSFSAYRDRPSKEAISGLLVGALGWAYTADSIVLLWADPKAYKENLAYMSYLDAGVMVGGAYLACTAIGIGCCYINPHVHEVNRESFEKRFDSGGRIFCGAMAIGKKGR